ncbi:MAG TPA: malto-oligosyltrehalose synthase, partial [Polyangia bacterium]
HPDGLYTPSAYFRRLHSHVDGLYLVVEKILEAHERMPESWRVDGTTGYELLNGLNGLYVAAENARAFDDLYTRFVGAAPRWQALVEDKKRALMSSSMASELHVLGHRLNRISERDRRTRDFTLSALSHALIEYVARLPVYRTYVEGTSPGEVEERDRRYIESTIARARRSSRHLDKTIYDFLRDLLLLERPDAVELVRKLQQVTGPVAAKAIEDSACYVYQRLVSLNEVGGDPVEFGRAPESFHALCQERLRRWPGSLNATSTHDTKRSEDVRLRISALSEIPVEWEARLFRWAQLNLEHKRMTDGVLAPDPNDELLLYQTLIGVFPDDGEVTPELTLRVVAYLEKALREAKVHSSWTNPDEPYEHATADFARALLGSRPFLDDFVPFQRRLAEAARLSSLGQVALKLAAPGVADIYQGCELWDLSLVDPDNRRPVDFIHRARLLHGLDERRSHGNEAALAREVSAPDALVDGRAKLLLTACGLRLRRAEPALFLRGEYLPLVAEGALARNVVAFGRRLVDGGRERRLVCVAPRLLFGLLEAGADLGQTQKLIRWEGRLPLPPELASAPLVDVVTGRSPEVREGALALDELLSDFPVALLFG